MSALGIWRKKAKNLGRQAFGESELEPNLEDERDGTLVLKAFLVESVHRPDQLREREHASVAWVGKWGKLRSLILSCGP